MSPSDVVTEITVCFIKNLVLSLSLSPSLSFIPNSNLVAVPLGTKYTVHNSFDIKCQFRFLPVFDKWEKKNVYISISSIAELPGTTPVVRLKDLCVKWNIKIPKPWEGYRYDRKYKHVRQRERETANALPTSRVISPEEHLWSSNESSLII